MLVQDLIREQVCPLPVSEYASLQVSTEGIRRRVMHLSGSLC